MDTDLLTVARTLASRGWLPGIQLWDGSLYRIPSWLDVTEADILLAVWSKISDPQITLEKGRDYIFVHHDALPEHRKLFCEDGTTTLSLLRCLRAACEAAEGAKA